MSIDPTSDRGAGLTALRSAIQHELAHLGAHWWWFMLLGALLVVSGMAAIAVPAVTVTTSVFVTVFLGVLLMISGIATIVSAFWVGRWSGFLVQLLVGLLYLACGFLLSDKPLQGTVAVTVFIALSFIVMGAFRTVGALILQFPQWGWALLNGAITLLAGIIIYRQLPDDALWVVGLLVGLEMLFNGWTWIMLAIALRQMPKTAA